MMITKPARTRHWLMSGLALLLLSAPAVQAESTEERLQRLENELQEVRQLLRQQQEQPRVSAPSAEVVRTPTATVPMTLPSAQSGVFIRYYIQNEPLAEQPPANGQPLAEGRITGADELSFDPADYDVPNAGFISPYRDPASYRYVGLSLEGDLPITYPGEYELVVYPQPAREGGATVSVHMSVQVSVDGRPVVDFRNESSRRMQRGRVQLEAGLHPVKVWAVAISDGFGPSPTASHLRLALKGPRDASPRPLQGLIVPAGMD